jgi:hypothetical protein
VVDVQSGFARDRLELPRLGGYRGVEGFVALDRPLLPCQVAGLQVVHQEADREIGARLARLAG